MNRALICFVGILSAVSVGCESSPAAPSTTEPSATQPSPVPGPAAGSTHTVSWSVGDECSTIPDEARHRTYTATVGNGLVTLTSGLFLQGLICTLDTGLGCNQFRMTPDGDAVTISVAGTEWHGGQIVEQISDGTWIEVSAAGTGRIEGSTIRATLDGSIWYCPTAGAYPFPCAAFRGCKSNNIQMTIVRNDRASS
jgi:hypothetical protein